MTQRSKPGTKKAQLIQMLSRSSGAKIGSLQAKLDWQPHTIRAEVSRLRKQGLVVTCASSPNGPVYRAYTSEQAWRLRS